MAYILNYAYEGTPPAAIITINRFDVDDGEKRT